MPKVKSHYRALPYSEVSALIQTVRSSQACLAGEVVS